ncbi:TPA: efflux RND transporter periplasmic adaptor subunit [Escherichia coli]|uniref:efflux RND transporter periplasmic adaptor subunit n=1 Tax=Escherichia coli TaxID=562 RepID=UPI0010746397|nr:efflux RND transporter periplasmic adaptor subunit [Escherichia coli]EFO4253682.1 efflux RND transporter periplasmic adaptor subunit [Escherichia coli]TFR08050.1 efflux RND transporter periplasmic adaptor subunit [Escherichia coli]HAI4894348.1 efflux RND transporter periplasmic adaptor subunit [Escherichia coli]HAI4923792.1 efflux RND transporter periplasmic adaptor subunit [Escherichia coli]HAI6520292.1 efflux RND transporter periplasmic adaptor subunit [Escherichia coli]
MTKHARFFLLPSFILISAALIAGCNDKGEEKAHVGEPQVTVHIVKTAPLEVKTELPGRTNAYRIAEVRPQVSGIVLNRNFTEGSDVQAGQSLYQIDPATYQASYDSAKGELAKSEAAAAIAHLTVKRYVPLVGTKYISQQEYDQAIADARQADAAVIAAKATVESARINLAYTKVTAPISGRIGKSTVTEGALVTNGQTTELATVQQLDPIYVDVTQSSNDFMRLKQSVEQGNLHKENATSNVELVMENGQTYPLKGTLQFSDVTVDEGVQSDAILIPQQGVSRTPRGDATVLIVNDKSQVEARPVVASQAIGDKWLISEGLKSGDQVIVSGLQKARPGEQVKATTDTPADTASK